MKHFKNHPVFTAVFALLLAIFVAGGVYDGILLKENAAAQKGEVKARKSYETALENDPTQKAIDDAEANLFRLHEHLNMLDKDLSRDNTKVLAPCPAKAGFELLELLVQKKNQWTSLAQENGIAIPDNFSFSFGRYLADGAKPPADAAVPAIWRQASIFENILMKLYSSKPKDSDMSIVMVQREVLPEETDAQAVSSMGRRSGRFTRNVNASETFEVPQYITARKKGSISALGYKIVFTGHTDAMRNFLNKLNSYDLMLVVRSVEVKPFVGTALKVKSAEATLPSLEDDAALAAAFAATDENAAAAAVAAPEVAAPVKDPVVTENVSEFTFIIEYVEVDKAQIADAPKPGEGRAAEAGRADNGQAEEAKPEENAGAEAQERKE